MLSFLSPNEEVIVADFVRSTGAHWDDSAHWDEVPTGTTSQWALVTKEEPAGAGSS